MLLYSCDYYLISCLCPKVTNKATITHDFCSGKCPALLSTSNFFCNGSLNSGQVASTYASMCSPITCGDGIIASKRVKMSLRVPFFLLITALEPLLPGQLGACNLENARICEMYNIPLVFMG